MRAVVDPRSGSRLKTGNREVTVGGVPAHMRSRRKQQAQPGPNRVARSDQKDRTGTGIEKDREELHLVFSTPLDRVD